MNQRSDATAQNISDGRVPPPEIANFETTRYCDLRCPMCIQYNVGTMVTGPHMDLDLFHSIAEEIFPFVKRWQPSVSGEPTMSKSFYKMLAMAQKYGIKLDMVTNATLLNEKMIDALTRWSETSSPWSIGAGTRFPGNQSKLPELRRDPSPANRGVRPVELPGKTTA